MRKILFAFLFCLLGLSSYAKFGYKIKVTFSQDIPDESIYLAKYFAKPPPTIYKIDSAKVINKRTVVFESNDSLLGGIYMVLFDKNTKFAEVIMDNGLNTEMNISPDKLPTGVTFTNSPENTHYIEYQQESEKYGKAFDALNVKLKNAKSAADSQSIRKEYKKVQEQFTQVRKDYIAKYPTSFVANVFRALQMPEAPEGKHYLADGKTIDSLYTFNYNKAHYWDKFDFNDNRLIHTPIFDGKLNDYFSNYVYPIPDSFNYEADKLLAKARPSKELFKYALHFLAVFTEESKIMGMDECFVHLVEEYYAKGDAYWMDSSQVAKYIDRASKIAPNMLGARAPELDLKEVFTLQDMNIASVKAPYTVLVFWSPECGHCQKEMPILDSLYKAVLKDKGVKVLSIGIDSTLDNIRDFITKYKLTDFVNAIEPNKSTYKNKYDVYTTPKMYLLDENKIIRGKGMDHTTILKVIDFDEKRRQKVAEGASKKG